MNKKLVWIIVALALLVIGVFLCFIALVSADFDLSRYQTVANKQETKKDFDSTLFSLIDIDERNHSIQIKPSQDDRIHVTYYENDRETYRVGQENGVLHIAYHDDRKWYERIGFFFNIQSTSLVLEIPKTFLGSIDIQNYNGEFIAEDIQLGKDMRVDSLNGKITLRDVHTRGKIDISGKNGGITCEHASASEITLKTSNGYVDVEKTTAEGTMVLRSSNGRISMNQITAFRLEARTSNGAVRLQDIIADDIELKTSNGAINGSIIGIQTEYSIRSQTSLGRNNLPSMQQGQGKNLDVETSNGSIDISFVTP